MPNQCKPGTKSKTGNTPCTQCAKGTYQNKKGQTECIKCRLGTISTKSGNKNCSGCHKGKYAKRADISCVSCPKGTSNNKSSQIRCTQCTKGSYQNKKGQTECKKCSTQPTPKCGNWQQDVCDPIKGRTCSNKSCQSITDKTDCTSAKCFWSDLSKLCLDSKPPTHVPEHCHECPHNEYKKDLIIIFIICIILYIILFVILMNFFIKK